MSIDVQSSTRKNIKSSEILSMDATALAKKIALQTFTAKGVVETYISHITKVNGALNCLVEDRFQSALKEAEQLDKQISAAGVQHEKKLLGVPISMKESFHVKGMNTTGGLVQRKQMVQEQDSEVVSQLKAEGAIILGKTNTPALCFCQETDNKLYGRTNNPWDVNKTAGGSSGGEGAILAVGGAAAGLGSDIGGSIRFPSHFNGIIGFKSGNCQVSQIGSFPQINIPLQERMLGIGPMTKSVRDAKLMYNIIAKKQAPTKRLANFKISILPKTTFPMSSNTISMLDRLYKQLEDNMPTEIAVPPYFEEGALLWQQIMSVDGGESIKEILFHHKKESVFKHYLIEKWGGKSSIHTYLSWALIGAKLFKPNKKRLLEIEKIVAEGDLILNKYLQNRIIIFPIYHMSAPVHGKLYKELFSVRKTFLEYIPYVAYANVWGLPSLTIPITTDEHGMPIAVQLISKNGNEDALFQLGELLENEYRGYIRCNYYD